MKTIKWDKDLDVKQLIGLSDAEVTIVGKVEIPLFTYLRNLNNVKFFGTPGCCVSGFPLYLVDCKGLSFTNIPFRSKRPTGIEPARYEKWWGWRIESTVANGCGDLTFTNCRFSGNTDEFAVHPDLSKWPNFTKKAGTKLIFKQCVFGHSLVGIDPARGNHNFAISVGLWDWVVFECCVFIGHNRRCPQFQGSRGVIRGCVVYGYGSMGLGIHAGSQLSVQDYYGFGGGVPLITDVTDTMKSPYAQLGKSTLRLFNVVDTKTASNIKRDLQACLFRESPVEAATVTTTTGPRFRSPLEIVSAIPNLDCVDAAVFTRILKNDFSWISQPLPTNC